MTERCGDGVREFQGCPGSPWVTTGHIQTLPNNVFWVGVFTKLCKVLYIFFPLFPMLAK